MKITFKMPDVDYQIHEAIKLEESDPDVILDLADEAMDILRKWIRSGEYVQIEFNLEEGTATVVPC